jgi:hypothetical protein
MSRGREEPGTAGPPGEQKKNPDVLHKNVSRPERELRKVILFLVPPQARFSNHIQPICTPFPLVKPTHRHPTPVVTVLSRSTSSRARTLIIIYSNFEKLPPPFIVGPRSRLLCPVKIYRCRVLFGDWRKKENILS